MQPPIDVPRTYGPLLLGGSIAFGLSGVLALQCILYYRLYHEDPARTKLTVAAVWALDCLHCAFIYASLDDYFIKFFGDKQHINQISWAVVLTVIVTGFQIFIVHCFFCNKIFKSSQRNWWITGPIVFLAFFRLGTTSAAAAEMLHLKRFSAFNEPYPGWIFTTSLVLSVVVDLLVMAWLCYFLRSLRTNIGPESTLMIRMVKIMTLYTLENGALTCLTATATLICWLTMPRNLVFLGIHFVIGKFYANSLLASLNTRKELRQFHNEVQMRHEQPWRIPGYLSSQRPSQISTLYPIKEDLMEDAESNYTPVVKALDHIYTQQRHQRPRTASTI